MSTVIGILFCGLIMMPGSIYLGLMTGGSMASVATWVTVILFDLLNARFEDRGSMLIQLGPALQHVEASETLFFYILTKRQATRAQIGMTFTPS